MTSLVPAAMWWPPSTTARRAILTVAGTGVVKRSPSAIAPCNDSARARNRGRCPSSASSATIRGKAAAVVSVPARKISEITPFASSKLSPASRRRRTNDVRGASDASYPVRIYAVSRSQQARASRNRRSDGVRKSNPDAIRSPRATSARQVASSPPTGRATPSMSNVMRPLIVRMKATRSTVAPATRSRRSCRSIGSAAASSSRAWPADTTSASLERSCRCGSPSMLPSANGPSSSVIVRDRLPGPFFVKSSSRTRISCASSASFTTMPSPGTRTTPPMRRASRASGQPTGCAERLSSVSWNAAFIVRPRRPADTRDCGTTGACSGSHTRAHAAPSCRR